MHTALTLLFAHAAHAHFAHLNAEATAAWVHRWRPQWAPGAPPSARALHAYVDATRRVEESPHVTSLVAADLHTVVVRIDTPRRMCHLLACLWEGEDCDEATFAALHAWLDRHGDMCTSHLKGADGAAYLRTTE